MNAPGSVRVKLDADTDHRWWKDFLITALLVIRVPSGKKRFDVPETSESHPER